MPDSSQMNDWDLYGYIQWKHRLLVESGFQEQDFILLSILMGLNTMYQQRLGDLANITSLASLYQHVAIPLFLPDFCAPPLALLQYRRQSGTRYPVFSL